MSTKKLSPTRRTLLKGTAASAAIAPFFIGKSAKAKLTTKIATVAPGGSPWVTAAKKLVKHFESRVEDIDCKLYLGAALGPEVETLQMVGAGTIAMWAGSMGAFSSLVPALTAHELPFVVPSPEAGTKALYANRQLIHDILWDNNLKLIMLSVNGTQHFGVNREVLTPADMKGLKIRTQESKIAIDWVKATGAKPVPMSVTEVLPSLQTGVIDGFSQTALYMQAVGWHKGVSDVTLTGHTFQPALVVASRRGFWDKLTKEQQDALELESDDLRKIEDRTIKRVLGMDKVLLQNLTDAGLKLHEPDLEPWRKEAEVVRAKFSKSTTKEGRALLKGIDDAV